MPLSALTRITSIGERSEATPGLWNTIFSQLSQNIDQLNIDGSVSSVWLRSGSTVTTNPTGLGVVLRSYDSGGAAFNVLAFGSTDTAIREALSAATNAGGGVVHVPPGRYTINSTISVPDGVSLIGSGLSSILTAGSAAVRILAVDYAASGRGSRYNIVEGLALHGGRQGLYVGLAVDRTFRALSIESSANAGLVVNSAQNCLFEQISIFNCVSAMTTYGAGIRFNHGAGNNTFVSCNVGDVGGAQVMFVENDAADPDTAAQGFTPSGPEGNLFLGCIIERPISSTSTILSVFSGRRNEFIRCDFSNSSLWWTADVLGDLNAFTRCTFTGHSNATAIRNSGFWLRLDGNVFETHLAGVETSNRVLLLPNNYFSGSGASLTNTAGNAVFNLRGLDAAAHLWVNQQRVISMRTIAASAVTASAANTNVNADEIVFTVGGASGASLCINSGGTTYIFHSTTSAINA